jgi:uncharacterized HAD superfamily protein
LRVAIDIDGTIADFPSEFLKVAEEYGYQAEADAVNMGLPRQQFLLVYNYMIYNHGFDEMQPYPEVAAILKLWKSQGHTIFYVTRRRPAYRNDYRGRDLHELQTKLWIVKNHFPPGEVAFTQDKLAFCQENEISILIEDYLGDALKWNGEDLKVYLVDRPWNQGEYPYRVTSLREVELEEKEAENQP